MAIKNKLDSAWNTDQTMDKIFEFRAVVENAYNVIQKTVEKIDEIIASANFQYVDEEIKNVGADIKRILKDTKLLLEDHKDFISWKQPEE